MPPASSHALFSIVAAASALDKLCGSAGRCLEVWEKNRGERGEFNLGGTPLENDSGSSVCRGLNLGDFVSVLVLKPRPSLSRCPLIAVASRHASALV
jgi:hypothetical protein